MYTGSNKCGQDLSNQYWHGPLAFNCFRLEATLSEAPLNARFSACQDEVLSDWEHPLPNSLRRHLLSVQHRKKLQYFRSSCPEHRPALRAQLKQTHYSLCLVSDLQGMDDCWREMEMVWFTLFRTLYPSNLTVFLRPAFLYHFQRSADQCNSVVTEC